MKDAPPGPRADQFDKREKFECRDDRHIRLENVFIESEGDGIILGGNCRLTLVDSKVDTTRWGIRMSGDASLTIRHSTVRGDLGAFSLEGNAKIHSTGSIFEGVSNVNGGAAFNDDGGNRRGSKNANAGPSGELQPTKAARCMGRERKLVIENKTIQVDDHAVLVQGGCEVLIRNCRIETKDRALVLQGRPRVQIEDSEIISKQRAIIIVGDAEVEIRNSRVVGRIQKVGNPTIQDKGGNVYE